MSLAVLPVEDQTPQPSRNLAMAIFELVRGGGDLEMVLAKLLELKRLTGFDRSLLRSAARFSREEAVENHHDGYWFLTARRLEQSLSTNLFG